MKVNNPTVAFEEPYRQLCPSARVAASGHDQRRRWRRRRRAAFIAVDPAQGIEKRAALAPAFFLVHFEALQKNPHPQGAGHGCFGPPRGPGPPPPKPPKPG